MFSSPQTNANIMTTNYVQQKDLQSRENFYEQKLQQVARTYGLSREDFSSTVHLITVKLAPFSIAFAYTLLITFKGDVEKTRQACSYLHANCVELSKGKSRRILDKIGIDLPILPPQLEPVEVFRMLNTINAVFDLIGDKLLLKYKADSEATLRKEAQPLLNLLTSLDIDTQSPLGRKLIVALSRNTPDSARHIRTGIVKVLHELNLCHAFAQTVSPQTTRWLNDNHISLDLTDLETSKQELDIVLKAFNLYFRT